jgi:hypothetical protein
MGCYGLVLYSISMSICSASIERYDLFNKLGMKFMYVCVYTLIAISSFVMFLYPSKWAILSLTLVIGSGFAVLYTLPFQILSRYFRSKIYLRKVRRYLLDDFSFISVAARYKEELWARLRHSYLTDLPRPANNVAHHRTYNCFLLLSERYILDLLCLRCTRCIRQRISRAL